MKKIVAIILAVTIMAGCSSENQEKPKTDNSDLHNKSNVTSPKETTQGNLEVEISQERVIKFVNSLDTSNAVYLAEIKNTGDTAVEIYDVSIDLEDVNGKIISSTSYVSTYPKTINAGNSAFVCESLLPYDSEENLDNIGKAIIHYNIEKTKDVKPINVEITEMSLALDYGNPKIVGRIQNLSISKLEDVYVCVPVYDEQGNLMTVIFSIIKSLNVDEKKGFEQAAIFCDRALDYSSATFNAFAYV